MDRLLVVLAMMAGALVSPAAAQTLPVMPFPSAGNGSLIIDQGRADRQAAPPPIAPIALPSRADIRAAPEGVASAASLKRVRVEGSNAPIAVLERAFQSFIGRALDKDTIAAIATALSDAYGKGDAALYTIVVPQQDLGSGVLILRVVEGYIDDVVITGDVKGRKLTLVRRYAARLAAEQPLRRPVLERYLSLIRDLPGLKAEVHLLNLPVPGAVRLVLSLAQEDFDWRLAVNNRGVANLGRTQMQATLIVNGAIREGDQTQLTASMPVRVSRYQYYALSHSTPLGADGLRIAANIGYLRTRPNGIPIRGEASSAGVTLSYPLKRGYRENINLSLGMDGLNSDNALLGQLIAQDHSRAMRAAGSWSKVSEQQSLSAALTLSKGLDIFGARTDPLRTDLGFAKLNGQASFNRMLTKVVALRLFATGQASGDRLPASEQFSMGGDLVGRAFPAGYVVGDRGYGGSAELALAGGKHWPRLLKGSEIYGFIDGGRVFTQSRYLGLLPRQRFSLASAGGGVRFNLKEKMVLGLEAARSIELPYPGTTPGWRFIIGWRTLR